MPKKHTQGSSKQFKVRESKRAIVSQEKRSTRQDSITKGNSPSKYHPEQHEEYYDSGYEGKPEHQFVYKPHQAREAKPRDRKHKEWRESDPAERRPSRRVSESRINNNSDHSVERVSPPLPKKS